MIAKRQNIIDFLNRKVEEYDHPRFIEDDPVCIPHLFSDQADIEIAGLFAAVFAWGNRTTIINKSRELMALMDNRPLDFILHHSNKDLRRLLSFKHRTFNATDLLYFIEFLQRHYQQSSSLEKAFLKGFSASDKDITGALNGFYHYFFSAEDVPQRTRKHIAAPFKNSTCKRLSMYLRWMVRQDKNGVDFGLWRNIKPAQLVCPIDVHVARVAQRFGLLQREAIDWKAALELTSWLRKLDPKDPVKYDFALFALGVVEKY
ncbi:TIGR02757 family protein [Flavihumibacter profundi]|uniref:TIGR02757 family protein n=1 Tax=Flavihumibacter profundi TaxID=2716883 RepID=UPI001CC3F3BD|nr:TIGR02757 family protein [Flavihumibacter profundi]MBZ5857487.1 TIGR02757 family protein [Flavihumibacter profundi]